MSQRLPTATDGLRIGAGAGFAGDRMEPAVELVNHAQLDALVFELLAERTIALAQRRKRSGSGPGYDERLPARVGSVLAAALTHGTTIITNGGAADPTAAGAALAALAHELGHGECGVAAVTGDDVLAAIDPARYVVQETGEPLSNYADRLVSANVYLGIAPLLDALTQGANLIVTGRTADAALFLAPLVHRFGWAMGDWARLAAGTVVGHLLECAGQLTGGYFADGGRKVVPGLARLGFPYAEVAADGSAVVTKVPSSGGRVDRQTCIEQLLYEVEDPSRYLTPDVVADMTSVELRAVGPDRVAVRGAMDLPAPATLKASVGIDDGFLASGAISYAGPGCVARAELAAAIIRERWAQLYMRDPAMLHVTYIGQNSSTPWLPLPVAVAAEPPEVRLRVAIQSLERQVAVDLAHEVEALYTNGPAGGGGVETSVKSTIGMLSILVERDLVRPRVVLF
ncbi:MAG: DUF1446 domain-containing protein [Caldilineaceae bacterium]|nr:DUF1446 domain-containing protein [Caldilineaceae bacterium]